MPASPQGGVKLSSSAKTGKALAHRIAVANRAHAISGAAEGGKVAVEDAGTSWGTKEGAAAKLPRLVSRLLRIVPSLAAAQAAAETARAALEVASAAQALAKGAAMLFGCSGRGGAEGAKIAGLAAQALGPQGGEILGLLRSTVEIGPSKVVAQVATILVLPRSWLSAAAAAYVCRRKAGAIKDAVKAGQLAYAPAEIGEIAPDVEPEQSCGCNIGTGAKDSVRVGAKEGAAAKIAKASTSNSDVMKSLAGEKDFLEAGADLYQAIASAQDWEPVVGNVATVAQQSRAR
ncbi:hypothetical protein GH714_042718 [Hevea brasiliensis]|uniref:Uncharacterized protein n=1 Tax=Hevea brasiliensis TaxID=3981 RepID=A0A6A6K086_HEVBR|nr:hypothetical protein GH714_042718 [Hevea brasiliensis]